MQENYYAELAKAVYAAAEKEHWSHDKICEMLKNPQKFEKYYENKVNVGMSKDTPSTPVIERMLADQQKRQSQKQENAIRLQNEQQEPDDMTLPSPSGKAKGTRSVKKFMNDQAKFDERRNMKLQELQKQDQSQNQSVYGYTASKKSKMILDKKQQENQSPQKETNEDGEEIEVQPMNDFNNTDTFERLYSSKQSSALKEQSRIMKTFDRNQGESNYYVPKINEKSQKLQRDMNIQDMLVNDAQRRQKRKADAEHVKAHVEQTQMQTKTSTAGKSQDLVFARLERDLKEVLTHHELECQQAQSSDIDYNKMIQIIHELGLIKNDNDGIAEVELCVKMWHHIEGDDKQAETVKVWNLMVFICAIQNFEYDWMLNHEHSRVNHEKYGSIVSQDKDGEDDQEAENSESGFYALTHGEIVAINDQYHQFSMNRQDFIMMTKKQYYQQRAVVPEPTYAPQTDSKSAKLTDGKRQGQTHDILFARKKEYQEKKQAATQQKEQQETVDCQPKPTRDTAVPKSVEISVATKCQGDVAERLYQDAGKIQARKDRTTDEAELQKSPDEFCFYPKILDPSREENRLQVDRPKKGKKPMKGKKGKPNKIEDKLTRQLEDQSSPESEAEGDADEINVEIALEGKTHKITLDKDSDPEKIGKEFAESMSLSDDKTDRLIQQLKQSKMQSFPTGN